MILFSKIRRIRLLLLVFALGLSVPASAQQTRFRLPKGITEKITDVDGVKINNVSGTVVKGSGHWLMEEATGQVIPAIVAFLSGRENLK